MSHQELMASVQQLHDTHHLLKEITGKLNEIETGNAGVVTPASLVPAIKTLAEIMHGLAEDIHKLKHKEISARIVASTGFDHGNA